MIFSDTFYSKLMIFFLSVPTPLKNQDGVIFGNVEEILQFHKTIFLKGENQEIAKGSLINVGQVHAKYCLYRIEYYFTKLLLKN